LKQVFQAANVASSYHRTRTLTAVFACLPAFMFAVYPLALVVGANAAVLPTSTAIIGRDVALALGLTAVLLWASRPIAPEIVPRGIWVSCFTLLFCSYGVLVPLAASMDTVVNTASRRVATIYTLASIVIATVTVRPRTMRPRHPIALNIVAAVLLSLNVYAAVVRPNDGRWREAAAALTDPTTATRLRSPHAEARDIYYIVLDGFGRSDVLRKYYALNLDSFVAFLRAQGFFVAEGAHSNYSQTYLSLASTLNMNYLDDLAQVVGKEAQDRRPLEYLIRSNGLMKIAREAGYEVVFIGSDYDATKRVDRADVCICRLHGLDQIEQAALALTPLGALPLVRWTHGAHRQKVLDSFRALEEPAQSAKPRFVFAHIIAPHPPFVFGPDGSPRQPSAPMLEFFDGDDFSGSNLEYVAGYRDQVLFVTRWLTAFIQKILGRSGPAPVIVFHGDHGPGSMLRWNDPQATNVAERMSIFAAYYLPDDGPPLYPALSPVNGVRALASRYFGVDLPLLPEKVSLSTWSRPYEFIDVSARLTASVSQ
jgi:hypothetical protein